MGRVAGTSREIAVQVVQEFIQYFGTNSLPEYTSQVWKSMSARIKTLGGSWNFHNVYTAVRENRRGILSTARAQQGIQLESPSKPSLNDSSLLDTSSRVIDSDNDYEVTFEAAGLAEFHLHISQPDWQKMRVPPDGKFQLMNRANLVKDVYQHILSDLITHQTDLPCVYIFKEAYECRSSDSTHFLRLKGFCKSKKCKNPMYAYVETDPGDSDFILILRTRDTTNDKCHEVIHRPLRGIIREQIGAQVVHQGTYNWRKERIGEQTALGRRINPTIPLPHVIHQAKKEHLDKKLGSSSGDSKDIRITLLKMQDDPKYTNCILDTNSNPFFVTYSSPAQRFAYKRYEEKFKKNTVVSGDGTGSVTTKFTRGDQTRSGHIFLYSLVIHIDDKILPIHQMLTESQHTNTLERWLRVWITPPRPLPKLPKPRQFVCDGSKALMNASCLAFNDQLIVVYVDTCFLYALGHHEFKYRPSISTFIRNDVAHIIHQVANWKSLKSLQWAVVREFYLYCVALLIDCQTIDEFREIFLFVCTVGLHSNEREGIMAISSGVVLDARKALQDKIAKRPSSTFVTNDAKEETKNEGDADDNESPEEPSAFQYRSHIKEWIDGLVKKAQMVVSKASNDDINAFEAPAFIKSLISLCYQFTMWTGVGIPFVTGRASSACSEGYFRIWKNLALKDVKCLRIDRHVRHDLNFTPGVCVDFTARLNQLNNAGDIPESPIDKPYRRHAQDETELHDKERSNHCVIDDTSSDSDVSLDNWKNKGVERKRKRVVFDVPHELSETATMTQDAGGPQEQQKRINIEKTKITGTRCADLEGNKKNGGKYFTAFPEIEERNKSLKNTRSDWVLKNANNSMPIVLDGDTCFVQQTCHYDAILQVLIRMAVDSKDFINLIESENNETLDLVLKAKQEGPTPAVHKTRDAILGKLFKSRKQTQVYLTQNTSYYTINTMNPAMETWTMCLPSNASRTLIYNCETCGRYRDMKNSIQVNSNIIIREGFEELGNSLLFAHGNHSVHCRRCKHLCSLTVLPHYYVCIELDIREDLCVAVGKSCHLKDIPPTIDLGAAYRLTGVIGFTRDPNHFIAYCKRADTRWEVHNDCDYKTHPCSSSKIIEPHLAVYIRKNLENYSPSLINTSQWQISSPVIHYPASPTEPTQMENNGIPDEHDSSSNMSIIPVMTDNINPGLAERVQIENDELISVIPEGVDLVIEHHGHMTESEESSADNVKSSGPGVEISRSPAETQSSTDHQMVASTNSSIPPPTMDLVYLQGKFYSITTASRFDSLVQLMYTAADVNIQYRNHAAQSDIPILKLISQLLKCGITSSFWEQRAKYLVETFSKNIHPDRRYGKWERKIKLVGTTIDMWEQCLKDEPSSVREYKCSRCGTYRRIDSFLEPDKWKIIRQKFKNLEKALELYDRLYNVTCENEGCTEVCTVEFLYNLHVYVKLLFCGADLMHKTCTLQDLSHSASLVLQSYRYKLVGVNAYMQGIYQTFIMANDASWMTFQAGYLLKRECTSTMEIVPAGALYIVEPVEDIESEMF